MREREVRWLLDHAPWQLKDAGVTIRGSAMLRERRRGAYPERRRLYEAYRTLARRDLQTIQQERLEAIIERARKLSPFYRDRLSGWDGCLASLPILEKEELRSSLTDIVIGDPSRLRASYTGGTTGAGIVVYNRLSSLQERTALVDQFWAEHGFQIGRDRVAWFSGRNVAWRNDVRAGRFWRTNHRWRIRYYSTFHVDRSTLPAYADDLNRFRPAYLSGFPSAIGELARFIRSERMDMNFVPGAVFTTSETLSDELRSTIEEVFGCPVRNQYASSEGAPWICECTEGQLHMDITTGVFEVLDTVGRDATDGELVVTSFLTQDTPLVRYRIGDRVCLGADELCPCGWEAPVVASIDGRGSDFIMVPGRGRVFAAQIGDCVKGVSTVQSFRVGLNAHGGIDVEIVSEREAFERLHQDKFLAKLRERVGEVPIAVIQVDSIPRLPSGKYSVIRP